MSVRPELELVEAAVRIAGRLVMRHFGRLAEGSVRFKAEDQPVTSADLEADRALRHALLTACPDCGWLSEETEDSPERLDRDRIWVVDPVDGTNSFVQGIPEFVVSVALVEQGTPVLAVVHNPATGELYSAERGRGAFLNGEPIHVAGPPAAGEPWRLLSSRSELRRGELAAFRTPAWSLVPLGSTAYRIVKVADGSGHAFFSRSRKHEWDVCAAQLVLEEAGGRLVTGEGTPVVYNRPRPRFEGVLAACCAELPHPLGARRTEPPPEEGS